MIDDYIPDELAEMIKLEAKRDAEAERLAEAVEVLTEADKSIERKRARAVRAANIAAVDAALRLNRVHPPNRPRPGYIRFDMRVQ